MGEAMSRRGGYHIMSLRVLLTTIPADLNGMTHIKFGQNETNVLEDVAMKEAQTIVQTHIPKVGMLYFVIIHVLG
jgi:hypothetical protein